MRSSVTPSLPALTGQHCGNKRCDPALCGWVGWQASTIALCIAAEEDASAVAQAKVKRD
jgi:hypothetical protein